MDPNIPNPPICHPTFEERLTAIGFNMDDLPAEFCDPIMCTLMNNPMTRLQQLEIRKMKNYVQRVYMIYKPLPS